MTCGINIEAGHPGTILYIETEQLDSTVIEEALMAAAKLGVTVNLKMTDSSSYCGWVQHPKDWWGERELVSE